MEYLESLRYSAEKNESGSFWADDYSEKSRVPENKNSLSDTDFSELACSCFASRTSSLDSRSVLMFAYFTIGVSIVFNISSYGLIIFNSLSVVRLWTWSATILSILARANASYMVLSKSILFSTTLE